MPPGPRGILRTTYNVLQRPFQAFPAWVEAYGDPFTIRAVNGIAWTTGRPELIKEIWTHDPDNYLPFGASALESLVGPRSIFLLEGAEHREERKLLMPQFRGERMRHYGETMAAVAHRRFAAAATGEALRFLELAQSLTLEIILRAVFGVETEQVVGFERQIVATMEALHPMFLFAPFTARAFGGFGPWARFTGLLGEMDAMLAQQIATARANVEQGEAGEDILSTMVAARYDNGSAMTDQALRDELITLVVAGHETTALTLAWAVYSLARNTSALAELREELRELSEAGERVPCVAALARAPYLGAVCDETLRLYPIITETIRTLRGEARFGEHTLPAGSSVAASAILAHFDPQRYPEPQRFRPARFLDRRPSPFEYLPFGGGHRRCLGAAFASYELRIVLAHLVCAFDIELVDRGPEAPVRRNLTMAPKRGVRVRLNPRPRP